MVKKADTAAPSTIIYRNISLPLPPANLAICSAAHSKKPISSRMSEIKTTAINTNVAFHTMPVTVQTSCRETT
ncbi:hypothetical protein D3C78_1965930 [compost metagenome]